jgi:oxygen-dependent protoporphyrinogen oxidase
VSVQSQTTYPFHVAVVGAGISGLSAAWYLNRFAPDFKVTILDAAPRSGGKVITHHIDGSGGQPFVLEAGADAFLAQTEAVGL